MTPENIFRKGWLIREIRGLLDAPRPDDGAWQREIAAAVDELDRLEKPFAPCDRLRFGGPVSRDIYINNVRLRYPQAFPTEGASMIGPAHV